MEGGILTSSATDYGTHICAQAGSSPAFVLHAAPASYASDEHASSTWSTNASDDNHRH